MGGNRRRRLEHYSPARTANRSCTRCGISRHRPRAPHFMAMARCACALRHAAAMRIKNMMQGASKPGIAVVGMGYWGKNLVRNFHELGALRVLCDSDPRMSRPAARATTRAPSSAETSRTCSPNPDVTAWRSRRRPSRTTRWPRRRSRPARTCSSRSRWPIDVKQGEELVELAAATRPDPDGRPHPAGTTPPF